MEKVITLCKLNKEPIAELKLIEDVRIDTSLTGMNEISFQINNTYVDNKGLIKENPLYNMIDMDMLLHYEDDYYIIQSPVEITDEGYSYKEIIAFSRQYELTNRLVFGFEGVNRVIYDPSGQKDENGVYFGFLNYVEEITDWKVNYYNNDVIRRKKTLSYDKVNILQVVTEIQKDFSAVLKFDTDNKTIDILDVSQVGSDTGLYLSNENFITNFKKELNKDNIITRLYCYGNEDLTIERVNITGQPYIEDFSYYMNEEYMSKKLIDELTQNKEQISEYEDEYNSLFSDLLAKEKEISNQRNGIRLQQGQLDKLEKDFDDNIEDDKERDKINKEIKQKQDIIKRMENALDVLLEEAEDIQKELNKISKEVKIDNNLSEESLQELQSFIREDIYNNTSHGKYNLDELYEEGRKILDNASKPTFSFELTLEELKQIVKNHKVIRQKLRLGDVVHIDNTITGDYYQARLVGMEETEYDLNLRFSSPNNIYDKEVFLDDLLAEAKDTSNTVDFSKMNWDKAKTVDNAFRDYIQSELDLTNQGLVKAEGQKPVLDDRGLWLYKEDKYGRPLPEQIRAVNNIIAVTKDNWETVEVAITPNGVMANTIVGEMILGTDLKIISNSGVVEILENLLTIRDGDGIPRVQLGEYEDDKYGLKLTDKSGRNTILDEDGMLQVWQEGNVDNVDGNHPLELNIYIPKNTMKVHQAILRFRQLEFRAYSRSIETEPAKSSGSSSRTSSGASSETTSGSSSVYTTSTDPSNTEIGMLQGTGAFYYGLMTTRDHEHSHTVEDHIHFLLDDGHSHNMEHYHDIRHTHDIEHYHTIPSHSHDIDYGIYKSRTSDRVKVKINNIDRTSELGGGSGFRGDEDELDITKYLKTGWNRIALSSSSLGRIDSTVFIQALIGYNG